MRQFTPRNCLYAAAALCIGLRLILIDERIFTIDEAFSYTISLLPPGDILKAAAAENHPPLFYLLLHAWSSLTLTPTLMRTLPALLQLAALPFIHAACKRAAGARAAALAVLVFALSPYAVFLAQDLRYPSLTMLLFSVILFFMPTGEENRKACKTVIVGICAAALAYSFYIGIFCLAGMTLYYIAAAATDPSRRRAAAAWIAAMILSLLLFLPWLGRLAGQTGRQLGFVGFDNLLEHLTTFPIGGIFRIFWEFDGTQFLPDVPGLRWTWFLLWSILALAGLIRLSGNRIVRLWFTAAAFTIFANWALMLAFGLYFFPKYHFMFAPMYYLCVAAGIESVLRYRARPAAAAAILLPAFALAFYFSSADMKPDNRDVIRLLNEKTTAADAVVINPPYQSTLFTAFYTGAARVIPVPEPYDPRSPYVRMPHVTPEHLDALAAELKTVNRIFIFYGLGEYTRVDPCATMLQRLEEDFLVVDTTTFFIHYPSPDQDGMLIELRNR